MNKTNKRLVVALAIVGGALVVALGIAMTRPEKKKAASWGEEAEGFLAVATPCCSSASLWDSLGEVTSDGQRARPASTSDAARWLDDWPYRSREDRDSSEVPQLKVAAQSSEVRCIGRSTGGEVPQSGDDEETLEALRQRRECKYTKWKAWSGETAAERMNERHTVWVGENGFFHGRVDYWRPK